MLSNIRAAMANVPKTLEQWKANIAKQAAASAILAKAIAKQKSITIQLINEGVNR
jgi:agmatine/peptidylarginine deiminase